MGKKNGMSIVAASDVAISFKAAMAHYLESGFNSVMDCFTLLLAGSFAMTGRVCLPSNPSDAVRTGTFF